MMPMRTCATLAVLLCCAAFAFARGALEVWEDCTLVPWPHNDGDSFLVRTAAGEEHRLRLYYVDAPETSAGSESEQRRVRAQAAHFGHASAAETIQAGREATVFAKEQLAEPFTVHTARATARGQGRVCRYYAFVRTADGRDLGELLVAAGLARAHGVRRMTPEGVHRNEQAARLRDIEMAAALGRVGAWHATQPDVLVERRAALRAELAELDALRLEVLGLEDPLASVDPNSATAEELQSLPHIGPIRAGRILEHRPYHSPEDLLRVPGIGAGILEAIRDRLWIEE